MRLPRADQYNIAVQNLETSVSDNDLRYGSVQINKLGLPIPYSGGFTTTYKVLGGNVSWAARCFIRNIDNLQRRYQAIDDFIQKNAVDYLVDARYLKNGIQVDGSWFPIIKMRWVEGDLFNIHIDKILKGGKEELIELAQNFSELIEKMGNNGIAHGDLQHGNIMIRNDKLCLIDYDGMFLEEIQDVGTGEVGHPNYQHPERTQEKFNKGIDRFSAIVIWLGLQALAIQPDLWKKYNNEENILFKKDDFKNPLNSELFYELSQIPELEKFISRFAAVCLAGFDKIPSLKKFIDGSFVYKKYEIKKPVKLTAPIIQSGVDVIQSQHAHDVFGKLYGEKTGPVSQSGFHYKPTQDLRSESQTTPTPSGSSSPVLPSKKLSKLQIGGIVIGVILVIIWVYGSNQTPSPTPTPTPAATWDTSTSSPTPSSTPCGTGECSFNGHCVSLPANASCVSSTKNAWKCNQGYIEHALVAGGTACFTKAQLDEGCRTAHGEGSYSDGTYCITPTPIPTPLPTPVYVPSCGIYSNYNSATGSCECWQGYHKYGGGNVCMTPLTYCQNANGYNAGYDSATNSCICNQGYHLSGSTCVADLTPNQICQRDVGVGSYYLGYKNTDGTYACSNPY